MKIKTYKDLLNRLLELDKEIDLDSMYITLCQEDFIDNAKNNYIRLNALMKAPEDVLDEGHLYLINVEDLMFTYFSTYIDEKPFALRFKDTKKVLNFPVEITEDSKYFSVDSDEFNIYCLGRTLEELREEIQREIVYNWISIAKEDDTVLGEKAKELKQFYLETFIEYTSWVKRRTL